MQFNFFFFSPKPGCFVRAFWPFVHTKCNLRLLKMDLLENCGMKIFRNSLLTLLTGKLCFLPVTTDAALTSPLVTLGDSLLFANLASRATSLKKVAFSLH